MEFVFLLFVWLALCWAVGKYAASKGFSQVGHELLAFLLSPLVGFIVVAVRSPNRELQAERTGMKKCPQCAEYVQPEARVCRFCRYEFSAGTVQSFTLPH